MAKIWYRGVYLTPRSLVEFENWCSSRLMYRVSGIVHITVAYSRTEIKREPIWNFTPPIDVDCRGAFFDLFDEHLVLRIQSDFLEMLHHLYLHDGATFDYPSYNPHISLGKLGKFTKQDLTRLTNEFDIRCLSLGREYEKIWDRAVNTAV